jgi:hypothetical protein
MLGKVGKQINDWSRWDSLRKLGSSPLVQSSLIFAAAGYVLLWNAKFQDFLTIKFDAHVSLWRIWMIYYGGICIAVATALYICFCPRAIKDAGTAFDLAQRESGHLRAMSLGLKYLEEVMELEASCNQAERDLWPPDRPPPNLIQASGSHPEGQQFIGSLVVYAWRLHNIRHPRLRRIILAIYCLGFALLAVPAVVTFFQVTRVGLRSLFVSPPA